MLRCLLENQSSGQRVLADGLAALAAELGRPLAVNYPEAEAKLLTREAAEETLAFWRKQAEQGLI